MSMLVRHVSEPIPAPATIDPTIDPQLAEWIEWLLKKDPKERPETAQEAWDRLEGGVIQLPRPRGRREGGLPEGDEAGARGQKPRTPAPVSGGRGGGTT